MCVRTCTHTHPCISLSTKGIPGIELRLSANTMTKNNFGEEKVYFILELPGHSPEGSQGRTEAEAMEES